MELVLRVLQVALLLALLGLLFSVLRHQRRTKRGQDELLRELQPTLGARRWFRVNVSRPAAYRRVLKMLPFEGKGLLIDEGGQLRLLAVLPGSGRLERVWPLRTQELRWVGNASLGAGNLHWLALGHGEAGVMVCADTGMNALQSREATADILRALLPGEALVAAALTDFALEKNRTALVTCALFLAVLCLTLLDMALSEHELLSPRHLYLITAALGLSGLLAYPLMVARRVPAREAMVVSGLLAIALCGGLTRGALRLDQWLAGSAVATDYRLEGRARLVPVQPGPPAVSLPQVRDYWDQFDPGTVHTLDIVHGPLGLWQLDRSRLNAATRDWYRRDDAATPPATTGSSAAGR
ncbi:hypothetical protein ACG04R_09940 [Roseateles sp. BYS78W]|uniref:Uncharacterized protein n=1 Tax=Pelomonas candidula TaxID=3299025 RepID=A0ABW7HBE2_9BURK